MTDRWMVEAEKFMMNALGRTWQHNVEALASALSMAEEAGKAGEREECAKVAEEMFTLAEHGSNYVRAAAWTAAAIRSRDARSR